MVMSGMNDSQPVWSHHQPAHWNLLQMTMSGLVDIPLPEPQCTPLSLGTGTGTTPTDSQDDYGYYDLDDEEEYVEYEVDEDHRDLPQEAQTEIENLHIFHPDEPHGFYRFRDFRANHPSKHPNYFQRVETHPSHDDTFFLQQLVKAQVPWTKQHKYPKHARATLAAKVVVELLCRHAKYNNSWVKLRKCSHAANDSVYISVIKAAAYLVPSIYNEDTLFRFGSKRTLDKQLKTLYEETVVMAREGISIYEVYKKIVELTADKKKYSFVTEGDVGKLVSLYSPNGFFGQVDLPEEDKVDECKIQVLDDMKEVVREMQPSSSIFQADVYTRMLMRLLNGPTFVEEMKLMNEATQMVNGNARSVMESQTTVEEVDLLDNLVAFSVLGDFICQEKQRMKLSLSFVVRPLFMLKDIIGPPHISSEILEIVEAAELRRMALGSRFIGRSHLIWAFYECGYELPKIWKSLNLDSPDKDHPPYHIYVAAMKLTVSKRVKKMRLEHFIFAVLFAQVDVFKSSEEQCLRMQREFERFMQAVESWTKTKVQPESSPYSLDTMESFVTGVGPKPSEFSSSDLHVVDQSTTVVGPKPWDNRGSGLLDTFVE